jgi:hypothetical protein
MKDHVIAFGDHPFEFHSLAGVIASGFLEICDEPFFAISDTRIVLDVLLSRILLDRLPRATLIEHQVVESHHVLLVALQVVHSHSLVMAKIIRKAATQSDPVVVGKGPGCFFSRARASA